MFQTKYTNMVLDGQSANLVFDADGNLTDDGTWSYTWDGENRLVEMEKSNRKIEFKYDWMGRRIRKIVRTGSIGDWTFNYLRRYIYDLPSSHAGSWNLLAELKANGTLVRSYMWGKDLSGTLNGAGGVGGLLGVNNAGQGFHFVAYDGNGNVMALVDVDDGTVSAEYEYGPFGELIRATGPMSDNPIRFSTKYHDTETGLVYYGYRYYWPAMGRWINRDPIGEVLSLDLSFVHERSILNLLYGYCLNDPVNLIDYIGLDCKIFYDCYLVKEIPHGLTKSCEYKCVEDTKKKRQQTAFGNVFCDDPRLPKPHTTTDASTKIRCFSCGKTRREVKLWGERPYIITDCSRRECRNKVKEKMKLLKKTCKLLKGPQKKACKAALTVIENSGYTACDLCQDP